MDSLFPYASNYKINILINDVPLDICSFAGSNDIIRPHFDESVSDDPDVTGITVFLRNSDGEPAGWRVSYRLDLDDSSRASNNNFGNSRVIPVNSLDGELPPLPLPYNLPMDRYTIVIQVMSGRTVLQRIEKPLFFLGRNVFSFEGINVYLPGISESSQLIPKGTIIMLETELDFDSKMDPYIIWYDGSKKIKEGNFSDGAGRLFWETPAQSGFFSLRTEVFPAEYHEDLNGYQNEISLLVTSIPVDLHLISRNIPQLLHWYTFEGNVNDSKMFNSAERALISEARNAPKWMGVNGTYGVVTGNNDIISLPRVLLSNKNYGNWQTLFRFKPINDGVIFTVRFGSSNYTYMYLSVENQNLVLTLTSPLETVTEVFPLISNETDLKSSFFTAGVNFDIQPAWVTAQLNILGDFIDSESAAAPITLNVKIENEFQISLGFMSENNIFPDTPPDQEVSKVKSISEFNVLWDEFALYHMPPMDILIAELSTKTGEDDEDKEN